MAHKFYEQIRQADVENLPADLANKATLLHNHDDRYYTRAEIDAYPPHGLYENQVGTSFGASGGYQLIPFETNLGALGITRLNGNTVFRLQDAGLWQIEAGIRFSGAQAGQTRYLGIAYPDNTLGRYAENSCYQSGTGGSLTVARTISCTEPNWTFGIGAISTGTSGFSVATDTSYTTFVSFTLLHRW